jgi:plastocyanin domain-containing protein
MRTLLSLFAAALVFASPARAADAAPQTAQIKVTEKGYEPGTLTLKAGQALRLTVTRTTNNTCGTEIVLKELGIKRALPLNKPEVIDLSAKQLAGAKKITFMCGMEMLSGEIVLE